MLKSILSGVVVAGLALTVMQSEAFAGRGGFDVQDMLETLEELEDLDNDYDDDDDD